MGLYSDRKTAGKCVGCGCRKPEGNTIRCNICKRKAVEREKRRRKRLIKAGKCRCGANARRNKKSCQICANKDQLKKRRWQEKNPKYNADYARKMWVEALDHYGGRQCTCCGETEICFLTIDHIQRDGAEHRRQTGGKSGKNLAHWLKKNNWPDGFQILCFNCNCGRERNDGICPHKEINDGIDN